MKGRSKCRPAATAAQTALGAAVIAVSSWLSIPIQPPITLQILAVFTLAGILGLKGSLSCVVWLSLGLFGLPVFSSFGGGFGMLLGPTGGYIMALPFAAALIGLVSDKLNSKIMLLLSMTVALTLVYSLGCLWYAFGHFNGELSFSSVFVSCVLPFVLFDVLKIAISFWLATRLKPIINS